MKKVNLALVLLLGAAPAVGATATIKGALAMAIAAVLVMVISSLIMSKLEKSTATIVAVTTVVTCLVDMCLNAFLPSLYALGGMYIALLACNMLTYSAAQKSVNEVLTSAICFAVVLVAVGAVRELLGNYVPVMSKEYCGLFVYAIAAAICNKVAPSEKACICEGLGLNQKEGE